MLDEASCAAGKGVKYSTGVFTEEGVKERGIVGVGFEGEKENEAENVSSINDISASVVFVCKVGDDLGIALKQCVGKLWEGGRT
jgi:hypothetical protein